MKSKFAGLSTATKDRKKTKPDDDKPKMGRPKKTAQGSQPVTLHLSQNLMWDAKAKLAADRDPRPLSAIFEELGAAWVNGRIKV